MAENPRNMRLILTTVAPSNHDNEVREAARVNHQYNELTGAIDCRRADASVVMLRTKDFVEDLFLFFTQVHLGTAVRSNVGTNLVNEHGQVQYSRGMKGLLTLIGEQRGRRGRKQVRQRTLPSSCPAVSHAFHSMELAVSMRINKRITSAYQSDGPLNEKRHERERTRGRASCRASRNRLTVR